MAGRGRGRGRGLSINIEALGLGRGEILPPVAHPPPLFPPHPNKPVAAPPSEELNYMLALKQELRDSFLRSPFYIKAPTKVKDIERYSDKYQVGSSDTSSEFTPDWSRLPFELQERSKTKKRKKASVIVRPNLKTARRQKDDVSSLLETLEQKDALAENEDETEGQDDENDEKKEKKEEGDEEEEEEYDEDDLEEETDYNLNYFDNGEDYGEDDEDDDEGPTY